VAETNTPCARSLLAQNDPRGRDILVQAHAVLQQQAARLKDESARRMFLENVPENRALCALYEQMQRE
jgi:hypothetical protein